MRIINLEYGLPNVEYALLKLKGEYSTARIRGEKHLKIIHGYGSNGSGGKIKSSVHQVLKSMKNQAKIVEFCPGESFNRNTLLGQNILKLAPSLKNDRDFARQNDGITIVILP